MLLGLKLGLVPLLIWCISAAGRRWGPSVAGWLSAFPVVAGPLLFFISMEQGTSFGAAAAGAMLLAILAHLSFGLGYAWAALRCAWPLALPLGLMAYVLCLLAISRVTLDLRGSLAVVTVVLLWARRLFPGEGRMAALQAVSGQAAHPRMEMALRMACGALLVMLVTWMARTVGPRWSGLLSMFPVLGVVLAVFSQRQSGPRFAITLLRDMVWGYFAFATFCLLLSVALPAHGVAMGFALAVAGALVVQGLTLAISRRRSGRSAPCPP